MFAWRRQQQQQQQLKPCAGNAVCEHSRIPSSGYFSIRRVTAWHRGAGHKRLFRLIDMCGSREGQDGVVQRIEYDPNRSARIALVKYGEGKHIARSRPATDLRMHDAGMLRPASSAGARPLVAKHCSVASGYCVDAL